jgi:iron complex outermembrane receptor protein
MSGRSRRGCLVEAIFWAALSLAPAEALANPGPDPAAPPRRDLTELSLTELAGLEVTTVARSPEAVSHTPAAVFVLTRQDILRSGARTLSEALRLAPGVQISRIDASQPTVGIRGFGSRLARSVLVLIDGRSVYTPLFAGTYWEVQDVLLEDIDRIEVIRGPGGTLWGANALNGVVNIITRRASETRGTYLEAGGGNEERAFGAARWGGPLGPHADLRVYGKYADRDAAFHADGNDYDAWRIGQGGFRLDAEQGRSQLTLQGDVYEGRSGERTTFASYTAPFSRTVQQDADLAGGNLRGLWQRPAGKTAILRVQAYYDHTRRVEPSFDETRNTGDLDLQYERRDRSNQLLGGVGYRVSRGVTGGVPTVVFLPPTLTDHIASAFLQDRIDLRPDRLMLTVGMKAERNDYSGVELQPSARVLWVPRARHSLWAAVSRAVRTPSRVDRDLDLTASIDPDRPLFSRFSGSAAFVSERAIVYEAGYRAQRGNRFLLDTAVFHNDYEDLLSIEPGTPFTETDAEGSRLVRPFLIANGLRGTVSGVEVAANVRINDPLRLQGSYSFLNVDLAAAPGSLDTTTAATTEGSAPRHRLVMRASFTRGPLQLDAILRRISELPAQAVPAYTSLNARLAWGRAGWEIALVGRDLLDAHHPEFGGGVEVERSLYAELTWRH